MAPVEVLPLLRPPGTELPAITGTIRRNAALMLLQFILPTIAILLFCTCISENLHSITVAVYDGDQSPFSRQILSALNSSDMIKLQHYYNTSEEAIDAVRRGTASTAIIIYARFTQFFYMRMTSLGTELEDGEFLNATIHLYPDMSNQLVITAVEKEVTRVFLTFAPPFLEKHGASSELLKSSIIMEEPVYGRKDPIYRDYMLPGIILSSSFFIASLLTAMILVVERKEQGLNTSYPKNSIVLLLLQACILLISSGMVVLFVFPIFGINYHGHLFLIFALTYLQSLAGMSFGVLLSALTKNENLATLMAFGFFYLNLLLNGTIWPTQTLRPWVKTFVANYFPQTMAINSMRTIITRGWTLVEGEVRCGFAVSLLWIGIFLGLSLIVFKCRKV